MDTSWIARFPSSAEVEAGDLIGIFPQDPAKAVGGLIHLAWRCGDLTLALDLVAEGLAPLSPLSALLTRAELLTAAGDGARALEAARDAIQVVPDDAKAWLAFATALYDTQRTSEALIAMVKAVRLGLEVGGAWRFDVFQLWLRASGEDQPRWAEILKPCPIFGIDEGRLDARTERVIDVLIEQHQEAYVNDPKRRMPPHLPPNPAPLPPRTLRVLLLHNEFVDVNDTKLRNDIQDIFEESALSQGYVVSRSKASDKVLMYPGGVIREASILKDGLAELQAEIEAFKPDIILSDGTFLGSERTLQPHHFANRSDKGFQWVVAISDLYDRNLNVFDYWAEGADLVVFLNRRTSHQQASIHHAKGLYWPGLPFPPTTFQPRSNQERDINFAMIGFLNRGREVFARALEGFGIQGFFRVHDRTNAQALSVPDYRDVLGRSRMVFSNGTISANQRIVTARVFETLWSGALLLEESGSDVDQLLVPFVHYVPFANVHQLAAFIRYFERHEDRRAQIAAAGRTFVAEHLDPSAFWTTLRHRLHLI